MIVKNITPVSERIESRKQLEQLNFQLGALNRELVKTSEGLRRKIIYDDIERLNNRISVLSIRLR